MNYMTRKLLMGVLVSISCAACCSTCPRGDQPKHSWPIEGAPGEHALGNALGEFQSYNLVNQHAGIDILSVPRDTANPANDAPWVVATVGGKITCQNDGPNSLTNECTIKGDDGIAYRYLHLYLQINDPNSGIAAHNDGPIAAGDRIAQVITFNPANFSHLHYDLKCDDKYLNPLRDIAGHVDYDFPFIHSIVFAVDRTDQNGSPWQEFDDVPDNDPSCSPGIKMVKGPVDILIKVEDHDGDGSTKPCAVDSTVGIYGLRWTICSVSTSNCEDWKSIHSFNDMPADWTERPGNEFSLAQYSVTPNWQSEFGYCTKDLAVLIVTDVENDAPSASGSWQTTRLSDGQYVFKVEVTDFGGNITPKEQNICVRNH